MGSFAPTIDLRPEGVTPGGPSVLVDFDTHNAPSINQHVAAIGGTATDDLALVERRVRGVVRLLQALFFVGQDLDLLAANKMTNEPDRHGVPLQVARAQASYLLILTYLLWAHCL